MIGCHFGCKIFVSPRSNPSIALRCCSNCDVVLIVMYDGPNYVHVGQFHSLVFIHLVTNISIPNTIAPARMNSDIMQNAEKIAHTVMENFLEVQEYLELKCL